MLSLRKCEYLSISLVPLVTLLHSSGNRATNWQHCTWIHSLYQHLLAPRNCWWLLRFNVFTGVTRAQRELAVLGGWDRNSLRILSATYFRVCCSTKRYPICSVEEWQVVSLFSSLNTLLFHRSLYKASIFAKVCDEAAPSHPNESMCTSETPVLPNPPLPRKVSSSDLCIQRHCRMSVQLAGVDHTPFQWPMWLSYIYEVWQTGRVTRRC